MRNTSLGVTSTSPSGTPGSRPSRAYSHLTSESVWWSERSKLLRTMSAFNRATRSVEQGRGNVVGEIGVDADLPRDVGRFARSSQRVGPMTYTIAATRYAGSRI